MQRVMTSKSNPNPKTGPAPQRGMGRSPMQNRQCTPHAGPRLLGAHHQNRPPHRPFLLNGGWFFLRSPSKHPVATVHAECAGAGAFHRALHARSSGRHGGRIVAVFGPLKRPLKPPVLKKEEGKVHEAHNHGKAILTRCKPSSHRAQTEVSKNGWILIIHQYTISF